MLGHTDFIEALCWFVSVA
uniref:Uncharacterized protein n=1 Tax=Arundo donax TaxID=35708 RepID=A0A0A8Z7K5_ARUDO